MDTRYFMSMVQTSPFDDGVDVARIIEVADKTAYEEMIDHAISELNSWVFDLHVNTPQVLADSIPTIVAIRSTVGDGHADLMTVIVEFFGEHKERDARVASSRKAVEMTIGLA